jgi:two-component system, NarL family, nitrate/nitrite response regulator NarL
MDRIRTLIVDDHALFRESVARVLSAESDLEISHCGTIRDALALLQRESFDLVLLDHDLGSERGFQLLPAAKEIGFKGRVLIVTAWVSHTEARRLLRQGVAGIFSKQSPLSALAASIRKVAAGQTCLDPAYERVAGEENVAGSKGSGPEFNDRQRRVLRFVLEGLSNKEIAWKLQISESYVKAILQGLFEKTGVRTRGQLVRVALEQYEDQL